VDRAIDHRSRELYYRKQGRGLPLLLIHGFAEDGSIWETLDSELSEKWELIIPDLPGSGRSAFNPRSKSIEDLAECIWQILEEEKIPSAAIIGHSLGGYVALAFADKYPQRLSALGLFHSTAYPDSAEKKETRKKGIRFIERNGAAAFLGQSIPNLFAADFNRLYPETVMQLIERYNNFNQESLVSYYHAMMKRPDRTHVLRNLQRPVLFIAGEKDQAVPLEHILQQCHLPDLCYIHILENTAHMGMYEDRARSKMILDEFLSQAIK
jgi:pimeloyl-ACP methyl ester carboxylesterase